MILVGFCNYDRAPQSREANLSTSRSPNPSHSSDFRFQSRPPNGPCADCGKHKRYAFFEFCKKCCAKQLPTCTACNRFFKPNPKLKLTTRCAKCVVEKRRKSSRKTDSLSVKTVSGGLPGLGKRK